MVKVEGAANPSDKVGPRATLLDFFKKHFMYQERSITQIKKVIGCFKLVKYKKGDEIRKLYQLYLLPLPRPQETLIRCLFPRTVKQGEIGDALMLVVTGVVELYHVDKGNNRKINQRLGANEVGQKEVFSYPPYRG